jgi:hypothetical protein
VSLGADWGENVGMGMGMGMGRLVGVNTSNLSFLGN